MKRYICSAAFALAVFATPSLAQSGWVEIDDRVIVPPFGETADAVDDWDVYSPDGVEIGEVEEVLGPDAQTPTALAVDFDGKAGFADRDVIVPLDRFERTGNRLILNADAEAVATMERWDD